MGARLSLAPAMSNRQRERRGKDMHDGEPIIITAADGESITVKPGDTIGLAWDFATGEAGWITCDMLAGFMQDKMIRD